MLDFRKVAAGDPAGEPLTRRQFCHIVLITNIQLHGGLVFRKDISMSKSVTVSSIIIAAVLLARPLPGQIGGTGSIQGVVSDPSGAVIPGASVTAVNTATQVKTTRQTNEAGVYNLSP